MKEDTKKSTKPAAKSAVKVKDMAPKKDAKGGRMGATTHSPSGHQANTTHSSSVISNS